MRNSELITSAVILSAKRKLPVVVSVIMILIVGLVVWKVIAFGIWLFTESPEQKIARESREQYQTYITAQRAHANVCEKKNGKNHFHPMIGHSGIDAGCGLGSRYNGVVCTWNNEFQRDLKKMWDEAQERNACVVWEPAGGGVAAFAEDKPTQKIWVALNKPKKKKQ
jgi:hypothetical protein